MGKKRKAPIPPQLPPEVTEEEVEVSDEDVHFVNENKDYAKLLRRLDTDSITKHVSRVADKKDDDIEALYEKRKKKKSLEKNDGLEVDPVDALPIKTLGGELVYRRVTKKSEKAEKELKESEDATEDRDGSVVKLTKAEKRAKTKKGRKEAKKQAKEPVKTEDVQENPQAGVLICKDDDQNIVKLGLLSLSAVFKDIIPGYRIRLPTEKELEMNVSKAVKKMRYYESTLLSSYKAYLQKLVVLEKKPSFQLVTVRYACDFFGRKLCCTALKSLFTNEGKHGGEATVEAVQLITDHVKIDDCQLHPDSIEVFLYLSFDEDLGKSQSVEGDDSNNRGKKGRKNSEDPKKWKANNKKRSRKDLQEKTREEVDADLKATSFAPDALDRKRMQTETLSFVFQTYFRILKHSTRSTVNRSATNDSFLFGRFGTHPLLAPCLNGLGKFSHLIDLDFMGDLMNSLKMLASGVSNSESSPESRLTVSERLRCCIVAFKVMRNNLDALNVDLQEFFVQLYNLILEYRPDRDQGEVLAEALKIMLCEGRQHDMQRAAAFVKRLATSSLFFGSAEAMAALVTLKDLLQRNAKCRNLLENDAGGGSLSGSVAKYQPCASDPNLSGALASVLWELSLLCKHYHPAISTAASSILTINTANQVYLAATSPLQAFKDLSIEQESFNPQRNSATQNRKRKNPSKSSILSGNELAQYSGDKEVLKKMFSEHFTVIRDISENESLRRELNSTVTSIRLYEEYKQQKKRNAKRLKGKREGKKEKKVH
ncbi:hypothetical protein IFM89_004703 [Coptis chinensis]|uniref:Nucleolar complex protein 3 homolog n=1 Tax=Coptis chinensis TaxID=261450 RepID=A0A835LHN8_9MAGN|nr:hypothetical protein IFM89_004703 [Coptis chinensis]